LQFRQLFLRPKKIKLGNPSLSEASAPPGCSAAEISKPNPSMGGERSQEEAKGPFSGAAPLLCQPP
jgi:hypothetical protein